MKGFKNWTPCWPNIEPMNKLLLTRAAWSAIGTIVAYQLLLLLLIFLRPDLDPSWHTISEWAIGPYGWLMTFAFLVSAISYLSLLIAIKPYVDNRITYAGWLLLLICVIGAAGVGIFTTDPMDVKEVKLSVTGIVHLVSGTMQLVLFPFAAMLITIGRSRASHTKFPDSKMKLWTAFIPLAGFVFFAGYTVLFVVPLGAGARGPGVNIGWPPRVAFFTYMIWVIIAANFCRKGAGPAINKFSANPIPAQHTRV